MDLNKNYYLILGVDKMSTPNVIKKQYYKLSLTHHPDKGGDSVIFSEISEAYSVLSSEDKTEYDLKSKFGNNYDELTELYNIHIDYDFNSAMNKKDLFKKNEINNIYVDIDDSFDGTIEFERYVICKTCDGTGVDNNKRILIKDEKGKVIKAIDPDDECDICEGVGKDWRGNKCIYCHGKGKATLNSCTSCNNTGRILGKQKLKSIKLEGETTIIKTMGNYNKNGKTGDLILKKKN